MFDEINQENKRMLLARLNAELCVGHTLSRNDQVIRKLTCRLGIPWRLLTVRPAQFMVASRGSSDCSSVTSYRFETLATGWLKTVVQLTKAPVSSRLFF